MKIMFWTMIPMILTDFNGIAADLPPRNSSVLVRSPENTGRGRVRLPVLNPRPAHISRRLSPEFVTVVVLSELQKHCFMNIRAQVRTKQEKTFFSQAGDHPTPPRCPRNVSGANLKTYFFYDGFVVLGGVFVWTPNVLHR